MLGFRITILDKMNKVYVVLKSVQGSIQFNHSVMSDSLQTPGLQHTRLPCSSPTPGACSNSCLSSWWCHPTISSLSSPSLLAFNLSHIRVFSNESVLHIRWPKYWSLSFSSPSSECSGLFSFRMDWLDLLAVQGTLESSLTPQFKSINSFGSQLSLWSNSHIHTWPLEKPQPQLDRPLLTKWCLCFLICCLGWS